VSARTVVQKGGEARLIPKGTGFLVIVVGAALGLSIAALQPDMRLVLLGSLTAVLVGPLIWRLSRSKFDLFEPLVVANLAMVFMFVIRPAADLVTGRTEHLGYDILPSFDQTLLIALVGAVSFQIGYLLPIGRRLARAAPAPTMDLRAGCATAFGVVTLLLGLGLFTVFIMQTGGLATIQSLLVGRQQSQNDLYLNSTGYFYRGLILAAPASLILLSVARSRNRPVILLGAIAGLSLVAYVSIIDGNRLTLLLLFAPPIILWYLMRDRRPGLLLLLLTGYFILTVGVGFLRDSRGVSTSESRFGLLIQAVSNPGHQTEALILGADNEMFDALASEVLIVPSTLAFQHGATISDVAVRSVPRPVWPGKPLESGDAVVNALWPVHYAASRASPAFSILGPLYADSGWLTVVFGMLIIGVVLSSLWRYFQTHLGALPAKMIYAISLPLVVILLRGSLPDTLSYVLFTVVPLLVLMRVAGKSPQPPALRTFGQSLTLESKVQP